MGELAIQGKQERAMVEQIDAAERSMQFLENSVKNYKIFVDACSLLHPDADKFWMNIVPILQRENKKLIIPLRVYEEVDKFASDPKQYEKKNQSDPQFHSRAVKAKQNIIKMKSAGIVAVMGDETDNFADNVFLTVFTKYRMKYNLMLVTQDNNLSNDIINIANSLSVNSHHRIVVEKINRHGFLSAYGNRSGVNYVRSSDNES